MPRQPIEREPNDVERLASYLERLLDDVETLKADNAALRQEISELSVRILDRAADDEDVIVPDPQPWVVPPLPRSNWTRQTAPRSVRNQGPRPVPVTQVIGEPTDGWKPTDGRPGGGTTRSSFEASYAAAARRRRSCRCP